MQFEVEIYDFHLQHLKIGSFHSCECRGKKIKEHCTILHTIAYYLDFRYTIGCFNQWTRQKNLQVFMLLKCDIDIHNDWLELSYSFELR